MGCWTPALVEAMEAAALAAGFDQAGVTAAPGAADPEGTETAERFSSWVAAGHAGEMEYLKRTDAAGELLRRSARVAMPWARSVLVCAFRYHAAGPRSIDAAAPGAGWIARYAWNGDAAGEAADYHDDLMTRLRTVEATLHEQVPQVESRCYVDTGPLLERDFAARAGVGWVGKNTLVIRQGAGSWMLLGVVVCSLELPAALAPGLHPDRCGSCRRCLEACPTGALVAPRQMDASRCIAYLTIEKKGDIVEELRAQMGRQVFGCDICQEVCPWNRHAPVAQKAGLAQRAELINPDLGWLGGLDQAEFRRLFRGSPLERTKLKRLLRNVAIAMGNAGEERFRDRLTTWAAGEDEVLAEAARWALGRLPMTENKVHGDLL